jgi:signal peptidase II
MNIELGKNGGIFLDVVFYSILVMVADQLSKYIVLSLLKPHDSVPIIQNLFHITYVQNTGAAFSILRGQRYFFVLVSSAIIFAIIYYIRKIPKEKRLLRLILGLVLGGAIGNLIDRVRLGFVVDFFDFRIWPVFNVADSALVVGVCMLTYFILTDRELKL